jgi:hypothetical protein
MPHLQCIVKLEHLLDCPGSWLQIEFLACRFDLPNQFSIIGIRFPDPRKEVLDDVLEERQIISEEFWHVDIP